jgi:hypothetical protein
MEKIRKHSTKIFVFTICFLVMVIMAILIKDNHVARQSAAIKAEKSINPIDPRILATQQAIVADREKKLRDANTTPQQTVTKQVTTDTKTTTTPNSSSSSSSSSKTKTS